MAMYTAPFSPIPSPLSPVQPEPLWPLPDVFYQLQDEDYMVNQDVAQIDMETNLQESPPDMSLQVEAQLDTRSNQQIEAQPEAQPDLSNTIQAIPITTVAPANRKKKSKKDFVLPEGWTTETKIRQHGSRKGHPDTYYYDPEKRYKFRAMVEVDAFVKDGTLPGRLRANSNANAPSTSSSAASQNQTRRRRNT